MLMNEHMKILKLIEDGEITPDEGAILIQELGQAPVEQPEASSLGILERVNAGEISAEDAIQLLVNQEGRNADKNTENPEMEDEPSPAISDQELEKWKQWWTFPLYIGVGIVVLSTLWINSAYLNSGYGFWFFCAWVPMLVGLMFMALAWRSQSGPWIHVRVKGRKERVAIRIPAPLGLASWALNTFGQFVPHLERTSVDEIINALEQSHSNNAPLYVQVDEGEDGERVEVFIG
jgi:hypothetical protein